ncbi:hypothetical protein halTADL_0454 [Halohasta litchfieldiae]|jgi:hypothetical protein|uniref:Uncharacterized protein n=1 Tax=Halohasta litchfieldiae TaxID=1073996 RepID=A0A1H6W4M8_9EURY|nr:hypothetical protein halTADL_0454 [Halohasta litchfieldiae]SEJ09017.1 hypothetical protein SAMN05444271_12049 [Halohasta litchfieldiae]
MTGIECTSGGFACLCQRESLLGRVVAPYFCVDHLGLIGECLQ